MRPTEVDDSQILAAGEMLSAAGKPITKTSLRNTIGKGNPARLMAVWLRLSGQEHLASGSSSTVARKPSAATTEPTAQAGSAQCRHCEAHLAKLDEFTRLISEQEDQLKALRTALNDETDRLTQSQLVTNALSDQLSTYKLKESALLEKDKQQRDRIADLIARIDEQRGELNRGAQTRAGLQRALDALQANGNISR